MQLPPPSTTSFEDKHGHFEEKRGHLKVTEAFECCFEKTLENCWSAKIGLFRTAIGGKWKRKFSRRKLEHFIEPPIYYVYNIIINC